MKEFLYFSIIDILAIVLLFCISLFILLFLAKKQINTLIGINKDITITQNTPNTSGNACITQSQDIGYGVSLSNVYLANFKI